MQLDKTIRNIRIRKEELKLCLFIENGFEGTGRGKGKLGQSERVAWIYIHYQM